MKKSKEILGLEQKLIRRGMLQTTDGVVIIPPKRLYKTLGEEILWILNQEKVTLSVTELSNYLGKDSKVISKVMRKLTSSGILVTKQKYASSFVYGANFNSKHSIPTMYKMMQLASKK